MTQATRSLRPKHAASFLGVSLPTLYRWSAEMADFPKPRRLTQRCTVFDEAELIAWRDARALQTSAEGTPSNTAAATQAKAKRLHPVGAIA